MAVTMTEEELQGKFSLSSPLSLCQLFANSLSRPSIEERERLTALVNVLGFASLDHLEDFVMLHGAARVVPVSSIAAAGSSLPIEDTQYTQTSSSYSETKHAQRNAERKRENLKLRSEVEEVRKELDWLRREHEKHVDVIEKAKKDKTRMWTRVEEADRKAEEAIRRAEIAEREKGEGGLTESYEEGVAALAEETSGLYDRIGELEEVIVEMEDAQKKMEEEIEGGRQNYDQLVLTLEHLQSKLETVTAERDDALVAIEDAQEEIERLKLVESKFDNIKQMIAIPSPAPVSRSSPRPVETSSARTFKKSKLSISTPKASPVAPSLLRYSAPAPSSSSNRPSLEPIANTAQQSTSVLDPSVAAATSDVFGPSPPTIPRTAVEARNPSPSPAVAPIVDQTDLTSALPVSSNRVSTPIAVPITQASTVASTSAALPPTSSSSARLSSVSFRQLKQYPGLHRVYLDDTSKFDKPQTWCKTILPGLQESNPSSLTPHPPLPIYPSDEFPHFEGLPSNGLNSDGTMRSHHPWIEDGTLKERYETLEDAEKRARNRLEEWKIWTEETKKTVGQHEEEKEAATKTKSSGKGKGKEKGAGTPTGTKALVKKRRRILREGGAKATPTSSATLAPTSSSKAQSTPKLPTSSATTASPARPQSETRNPLLAQTTTKPALVTGETQLPASPERSPQPTVVNGMPSTSKKKNWNLLSPKKKKSSSSSAASSTPRPGASTGSPSSRQTPKSPSKSQSGPVILVDDTQLEPVLVPRSDATMSQLEPEPDTLKSSTGDDDLEPDTIRSNSRPNSRTESRSPRKLASPTKKSPLRRTSAVSHDPSMTALDPKPPFSPSYAARMQRKAITAVVEDPSHSTSARSPFQPSPNRYSQNSESRSPSSSPLKGNSFPMPPSAQVVRPSTTRRETESEAEVNDDVGRGLLFSPRGGGGAPSVPSSARRSDKGKGKEVVVKQEEEEEDNDDDPFADDRSTNQRRKDSSKSPSPKKKQKQKRKSDGKDDGRTSKRSRKSVEATGFDKDAEEEEEDVKPVIGRGESGSDSLGEMPMGSADEDARRLWIKKLAIKRHEKVNKIREEKASKSSPRIQVELNPDRNQGEKHAFKQTERRKAVRQSMVAEACGNCKAYYDRKKEPVPVGPCKHADPPTAASTSKSRSKGGYLDLRAAEAEKRMQQDGRHRAAQRTVPEPPDYWQMGFPSTQQAEKINAKAKQQKAEQEKYKIIEAEQANGKYRYRNEKNP
ncbi:uncharacterized protein JCM6883_002839 [Sporobolomyces salmoneus]|uniref:uncharacterized protein n=1 Tax=Sporobolomyces salmoneus TaxID=183962 RepID=UPI00317BDFDA